jgi:TfoX/Sxy family transcriptional regulator of competence genes
MATRKETIEFILDQLAPLPVRARAMFGGHALYCDEKVVALIGDDTLFVKPAAATRELFGDAEMAPPYPGAKDYHVVSEDRLHDAEWLQDVITRTAEQLPMPKKKART